VISFLRFRGPVITTEFGLGNFVQLFARAPGPLANTLILAAAAALGAALIGVPIGYVLTRTRTRLAGLLDVVAMMPFAVAGTVLGIGLVIAFNAGFLVLTGGWLILVIAYVVRKLPFNVRASSAILHQIDPSLEEASINLGVSPAMTFVKLTVPLMLGGIVGGAVLTFVTVASELSATVILYSGKWSTMTIVMFQALEGTGAGVASAAATMLIVVTILPLALVNRLLRRQGLARLRQLAPPVPVQRYQWTQPGSLVHLDIKKLARIGRVGHRITGDRRTEVRGIGWEYVHVAVDDASRLAYVEVLPDESGVTTTQFLWRARAWFRRHGIRIRRLLTDNGPGYVADRFARLCRSAGVRHLRTRPYTPRTNGKAERFIQTLLREWAYRRAYPSSRHRTEALPAWLYYYNWARGHGALRGRPPISCLVAPNNLLAIHSWPFTMRLYP